MHAAGEAWIETSDRTHDIDSLEFVRTILLKDRRVLHGIFIRAWRPVDISWICVPGSRRIWMVVGDLVISNDNVMRQYTADGFVEATSYTFFRNFEIAPGSCSAGMQLCQSLFGKVQRGRSGIGLEVGTRTIAFNGIAPLGDLPF